MLRQLQKQRGDIVVGTIGGHDDLIDGGLMAVKCCEDLVDVFEFPHGCSMMIILVPRVQQSCFL